MFRLVVVSYLDWAGYAYGENIRWLRCAFPYAPYQGSFALSTGMNFHPLGGIDRRALYSTTGRFSAGDEERITASQPKLHLYIPRAFVPRSDSMVHVFGGSV